jgi:3-isopropylmalate/(R)-2-methylmalate dehydratase small subunit
MTTAGPLAQLLKSLPKTSSIGTSLVGDGTWSSMPPLTQSVPRRRNAEPARITMETPRRRSSHRASATRRIIAAAGLTTEDKPEGQQGKVIHGKCFVVGDNIDTDQIIPAEYLTLVPSKPDEYEKLGSYAMIGLPPHYGKFIEDGKTKTEYTVMIGGANFGCGSSREHAPVAMGAAGIRAVVAESYARIFFRNSVATGELYPVEAVERICDQNTTGDVVTVDLGQNVLINHTNGKQFSLIPIGDAGPVIDAGGIFNFARASGMIAAASS